MLPLPPRHARPARAVPRLVPTFLLLVLAFVLLCSLALAAPGTRSESAHLLTLRASSSNSTSSTNTTSESPSSTNGTETTTEEKVLVAEDFDLTSTLPIYHITGPHCYILSSPVLKLAGNVPGNITAPGYLDEGAPNVTNIQRQVKSARFLNMTESYYSCVDGRYTTEMVAAPGGDSAEFITALAVANVNGGVPMNYYVVLDLLTKFLDSFEEYRKFYMHSDIHAWERMLEYLHLEELDIADPPPLLRPKLMQAILMPEHIGCGHLKLMLQNLDTYGIPSDIYVWFWQAYFEYMWTKDLERPVDRRRILYVVLNGDHHEKGVLAINDTGCPGMAAAVKAELGDASFFVTHPSATNTLRYRMAKFFQTATNMSLTQAQFVAQMDSRSVNQTAFTLSKLASGLPIYTVNFVGDRLSTMVGIGGAIIAIMITSVFLVLPATIMLLRKVASGDYDQVVVDIKDGLRYYGIRLALFTLPAFAIGAAIVGAGSSFKPALAFVGGGIAMVLSCTVPIAAATGTHTRIASQLNPETSYSVHTSARIAYKSGIVQSFVSLSIPVLGLCLAAYFSNVDRTTIGAYGIGTCIASVFMRLGSAVLHKASSSAHLILTGSQGPAVPEKKLGGLGSVLSAVRNVRYTSAILDSSLGTTADLVSSTIMALIAATAVGTTIYGEDGIALPFWILACGILASFISAPLIIFAIRFFGRGGSTVGPNKILWTIRSVQLVNFTLFLIAAYIVNNALRFDSATYTCIAVGHAGGLILSIVSEFSLYSSQLDFDRIPGAADVRQRGKPIAIMLKGALNAFAPILVTFTILLVSAALAQSYGVAMAAVGLLASSAQLAALQAASSYMGMTICDMKAESNGSSLMSENLVMLRKLGGRISNMTHGVISGAAFVDVIVLFISVSNTYFSLKESTKEEETTTNSTSGSGASMVFSDLGSASDTTSFVYVSDLVLWYLPGALIGILLPVIFSSVVMVALVKAARILIGVAFANLSGDPYKNATQRALTSLMWYLSIPILVCYVADALIDLWLGPHLVGAMVLASILSGITMGSTLVNAGSMLVRDTYHSGGGDHNVGRNSVYGVGIQDLGQASIHQFNKILVLLALTRSADLTLVSLIFLAVAVVFVIGGHLYLSFTVSSHPETMPRELRDEIVAHTGTSAVDEYYESAPQFTKNQASVTNLPPPVAYASGYGSYSESPTKKGRNGSAGNVYAPGGYELPEYSSQQQQRGSGNLYDSQRGSANSNGNGNGYESQRGSGNVYGSQRGNRY